MPPRYIFQDTFETGNAGQPLDASDYRSTELDHVTLGPRWGSPGSPLVWASSGAAVARGNLGSGDYVQAPGVPLTRNVDASGSIALVSLTGAAGYRAAILVCYDGTIVFGSPSRVSNGISLGLELDGSGGLLAYASTLVADVAVNPQTPIVVPTPTAGDVYLPSISLRVSGADLTVACAITRGGDYLTAAGAFQVSPADAFTWTIAGGATALPIGSLGLHSTSAGAVFTLGPAWATDFLVPATEIGFSGPTAGFVGIPSADFTCQPNGNATDTVTLGTGWSPSSLAWSASADGKTATYTAPSAATWTLSPTATLPLSPTSLAYDAAVGPHVGSVDVLPSRDAIAVHFVDGAGAATNVVSVGDLTGAFLTVNGVDVALPTPPLIQAGALADWLFLPLREGPYVRSAIDDGGTNRGNAGTPTFSVAGAGWSILKNNGLGTAPFFPINGTGSPDDQARVTTGPTDTAKYTFTGLTPGRNRIAVNMMLQDPIGTVHAGYTCRDGVGGTVVATLAMDQTAVLPFDLAALRARCTVLGHATIAGTTLEVTVTNAAGSGQLLVDVMAVDYDPLPVVPAGATCTFTLPASAVTTVAGAVAEAIAVAVGSWTDAELMPFDPSLPRPMASGWNLFEAGGGAVVYADLMRTIGEWVADPGGSSATFDADGNFLSLTGTARNSGLSGPAANLSDNLGVRIGPAGPVTYRWIYDDVYGRAANIELRDNDFFAQNAVGITCTKLGDVSNGDGTRTATWRVDWPDFIPVSEATRPPIYLAAYAPILVVHELITGPMSLYDDANPTGRPPFHSQFLANFQDRNTVFRTLDMYSVNSSSIIDYADFTPTTLRSIALPRPTIAANLVTLLPAEPADFDLFAAIDHAGICRLALDGPFPLGAYQHPSLSGTLGPYATDQVTFADQGSGGGFIPAGTAIAATLENTGNGQMAYPIDSTTVLYQFKFDPGTANASGYGGTPPTLAGTHDVSGAGIAISFVPRTDMPFEDAVAAVAACNPRGGWFHVPQLATDACSLAQCEAVLAGTTAGTMIFVEYENEPWNDLTNQYHYDHVLQHTMMVAHAANPTLNPDDPGDWMEAYTARALQHRKIWRAAFLAAGRLDDLVWVMGGAQANPGFASVICGYAYRHRARYDAPGFEALLFGDYLHLRAVGWATDEAATQAILDHAGPQAAIDAFAMGVIHGGYRAFIAGMAAILDDHTSYPDDSDPSLSYFRGVAFAVYEGGGDVTTWGTAPATVHEEGELGQVLYRDDRMEAWELARHQVRQQDAAASGHPMLGILKYSANHFAALSSNHDMWCDIATVNGPGTAGVTNPQDFERVGSPTARGIIRWAEVPVPSATATVVVTATGRAVARRGRRPPDGRDHDLGRCQQGGAVPLAVLAAAGDPGVPFRVYGGGLLVASGVLAGPLDPDAPDRFAAALAAGRGLPPGRYQVVYHYGAGGVAAATLATFAVAPGGDAAGPAVAGLVLHAAEADVALVQSAAGPLLAARGPYLDEGID